MTDLPRGIRNNNPGNIEVGAPWQGLVTGENVGSQSAEVQHAFQMERRNPRDPGRFAVFAHGRWGIRAIARVLITYQDRRRARDGSKIDTVCEIVQRWAPSHENDTSAYARHVRQRLGLDGDEVPGEVDIHDYDDARRLVKAIILHENGMQPYSAAEIDEGLRLAGIEPPKKPLSRSRTLAGQTAAAAGTAGAAALEVGQEMTEAAGQVSLLVEYGWVFQVVLVALVLSGIGFTVYARLSDRSAGLA
ncbi:hypothetical protein [Algihabitans sp.]|uniref:hypothetical protein n=1 Tax=Algihabitans sp. TaxID=2821514 RepID=UPI003BA9BCDB